MRQPSTGATVTLHIERAGMRLWEGSLDADLGARAYRVRFELKGLPLSAGTYELSLSVEGAAGLRTTVPLDPGLVIAPGPIGGPIVAVSHTGSCHRALSVAVPLEQTVRESAERRHRQSSDVAPAAGRFEQGIDELGDGAGRHDATADPAADLADAPHVGRDEVSAVGTCEPRER